MSKWKRTTLGEVVSESNGLIQTGPFGSQLHASDYVENGIPCIMPTNMKENRVSLTGIARISDKDAQRLSQHLVKSGDIVYSRRGDITQKALISDAENGFFCGTGCILIRPGGHVNSQFLTYFLSTKEIKEWLINHAVGITMPNLNTKILSKLPLRLPSKDHQEKIADVLSSIDEKIEINNRINAELEAMAKTLYDYWFVQFDFPDENGKPYKSSGGKMVYSKELKREIPAGWDVKSLSDLTPVLTGKEDANFAMQDGQYSYFTCGEEILRCDTYAFEGKAVLVAGNGNFNVKFFNGKFNAYQRTYVLIPYNDDLFASLYYSVTNLIGSITKGSRGSIVKFMTRGDLADIQIAIPKQVTSNHFSFGYPSNLLLSILIYKKENRELAALRDWLLPMLMNGQVRVDDKSL